GRTTHVPARPTLQPPRRHPPGAGLPLGPRLARLLAPWPRVRGAGSSSGVLAVWAVVLALLWSAPGLAAPASSAAGPSLVLHGLQLRPMLALAEVPAEIFGQPVVEIRFEGNRRVESEAMLLEL